MDVWDADKKETVVTLLCVEIRVATVNYSCAADVQSAVMSAVVWRHGTSQYELTYSNLPLARTSRQDGAHCRSLHTTMCILFASVEFLACAKMRHLPAIKER